MKTTKVFKCGNSMAVRLPKSIKIKGDTVMIKQIDDKIILQEIPQNLGNAFTLLTNLSDDFLSEGREDKAPEKREDF